MNPEKIYPRTNDRETVYLKSVVKNPGILVHLSVPDLFRGVGPGCPGHNERMGQQRRAPG